MKDILLLLAVIPAFIFGYYIMKRVDLFICENEKRMNEEINLKEPSSVRLSGDMPLMEIDKEIDKYRKNHSDFEIILKDKSCDEDEH